MMPYNGMLNGVDNSAKGQGQATYADLSKSFSSAKSLITKIFGFMKWFDNGQDSK